MLRLAFVIAALAACGPSLAPAGGGPTPTPTPTGPKLDGSHDAVCAWGHRGEPDTSRPKPAECQAPLQCCYPCGIDGCDSVCHTAAECAEDMTRP